MIALPKVLRPRVGLLVTAAVVLALTGCGPVKAGSAATVGDESLPETTVATTSEEIDTVVAEAGVELAIPPTEVNLNIVASWVDQQLTQSLAAAEGITVTAGEVDRFLERYDDKARVDITAQLAIPPSQLEQAAETLLLKQKVAQSLVPDGSPDKQGAALQKALGAAADDLGVSVNPRFGAWDACASGGTNGAPCVPGVVPTAEDRLSSPVQSDAPVESLPPAVP